MTLLLLLLSSPGLHPDGTVGHLSDPLWAFLAHSFPLWLWPGFQNLPFEMLSLQPPLMYPLWPASSVTCSGSSLTLSFSSGSLMPASPREGREQSCHQGRAIPVPERPSQVGLFFMVFENPDNV